MPKKYNGPESDSDSDSDNGRTVHHHHHHYHMEGGAINFKKIGNTIKSGFQKTFTPKLGRQIASAAIHQGIPIVAGLAGDAVAGPLGGVAAGYAGQEAAKAIGKSTGYGIKRQGRFPKGSQEAKDHMARIRGLRKK